MSSAAPGFEAVAISTRRKFRPISGSGAFSESEEEQPPPKESKHAPHAICIHLIILRVSI